MDWFSDFLKSRGVIPPKRAVSDATRVKLPNVPQLSTIGPLQIQNAGAGGGLDSSKDTYEPLPSEDQGVLGSGNGQSVFDVLPGVGAARGVKSGVDVSKQSLPLGLLIGGLSVLPEGGAIASKVAAKVAPELHGVISELMKDGGATLTREGKHFAGSGYMVADPNLTAKISTPEEMEAFLKRPDVVKGLDNGKLIGKWTEPGTGVTEVNLSDHHHDLPSALELGTQRAEKAVGHIKDGNYEGDIEVPFPDAPVGRAPRTPQELEALGRKHGVQGLGRVSPPEPVTLTDGRVVHIPGGTEGTFSHYDKLALKAEGINPNLLPEGMHEKIHAKIIRSTTPEHFSDEDMFRGLLFGITSPNSPLTPNEFTVSRAMPRNMKDIKALAKMNPADVPHKLGVDAASKGGLGTSGSVDYAQVVNLAKMFSKDPKFFRRAAAEPWDQYVDRISTQVPGLGTKTGSLGVVWQDLPNAAVSAVDRHMTELAMPHILEHPELGPDFRKRVVDSWNNSHDTKLTSLEQIREKDPIFARDFLASLINSPTKALYKNAKGQFGPNVPEWAKSTPWVKEPEAVTQMNPYYREALKYNAARQGKDESLFASQWRVWDPQRGRIEPHEVMTPGLNRLPRMPLRDAKKAYAAHKEAGYTLPRPTVNHPVAVGGQLPAVKAVKNPMDLLYYGLGGLLLGGGALSQEQNDQGPGGLF